MTTYEAKFLTIVHLRLTMREHRRRWYHTRRISKDIKTAAWYRGEYLELRQIIDQLQEELKNA